MASIRNKCTKTTTNSAINANNNNNNNVKSYAKKFDLISGNNNHHINGNNSHQSSRPQLRWSQSFSPTDRQKPNVSTLIRRKSAVERLAETKYNYIKCSPTLENEKDFKDNHKYIQKSLSTGKTPLVILTQTLTPNPTVLLANSNHQNQNLLTKCDLNIHSSTQTTSTPTPQTVTRKRNSSLSSRLSEGSNNLEIALRQLIAENEDNDNQLLTNNKNSNNNSVINNCLNKTIESTDKPKPKERTVTTNQQILRQTVATNQRNVIKSNERNTSFDGNKKTNTNNNNKVILRSKSSHNFVNTNPIAQQTIQKSSPLMSSNCSTSTPTPTPTPSPTYRQLSISRSKSDVSNRLLIRRNKSKDEIERFFETLGLDSSVWDSIRSEATNSMVSTPPHYFESSESLQSGVRPVVHMSSSSSDASSVHSTGAQPMDKEPNPLNSRLMQSRSCHALSSGTSIVEKNARVIKWLYNCRKAMV